MAHSVPASQWLLLALCVGLTVSTAILPAPTLDQSNPTPVPAESRVDDATSIAYRLPNTTRPLAYDVHVTTNVHLGQFSFTGIVLIRLEAVEPTRSIVLHQRSLTITAARLLNVQTNATVALAEERPYNATTELLTVSVAAGGAPLTVGTQYVLELSYTGELRGSAERGFYRSSYTDAQNNTKWLAVTQFQSTDARHGFPCFDEPALRATFAIKVTHGSEYFALSNMPVLTTVFSVDGLHTTTTFQTTPLMPTYLVAYVVSDFVQIESANNRGFVQRVFARSDAIASGQFGLKTGHQVLDALSTHFQIAYTLPKMDQVAVPQFAAGAAMENWGLVVYRQDYLLYDESVDRYSDKFSVARMIAHEYVHQWFGNLVTPLWWSYAWLNEGFATLYEYAAVDWVLPGWRMLDAFQYTVVQRTLLQDAEPTARPMTQYTESPTGIADLFNFVAYGKSGSVLRMFQHAFGETTFHKALVAHLNRGKNSVASEADLFNAIAASVTADRTLAANLDAPLIMSSWTRQSGYPLVTVQRDYSADGLVIHLQQQRYFSSNATTSNSTWWIPYNFATAVSTDIDATLATHWLPQGITTATVNLTADLPSTVNRSAINDQWLLLNKRHTGYYRVQYDRTNYALLSTALRVNPTIIPVTSRSQLVDDVLEFARTERFGYDLVFDVLHYLANETDSLPWSTAFRGLELLDRLHSGSAHFDRYQRFVGQQLMARVYSAVGVRRPATQDYDDEAHLQKALRVQLLRMACQYGLEQCRTDTNALLTQYLVAGSQPAAVVHHDQRAEVLCGGVRTATVQQYEQLWNRFVAETNEKERHWLIDGLACTANRTQLAALAASSTNAAGGVWRDYVERYRAMWEVMSNHAGDGVAVAFEHLTANLEAAELHYTNKYVNAAVIRLASMVNNAERKKMFDALMVAVKKTTYVRPEIIKVAEESVVANLLWVERSQATLERWIEVNAASTTTLSTILLVALVAIRFLF